VASKSTKALRVLPLLLSLSNCSMSATDISATWKARRPSGSLTTLSLVWNTLAPAMRTSSRAKSTPPSSSCTACACARSAVSTSIARCWCQTMDDAAVATRARISSAISSAAPRW
jgi:hypothetical protein